MKRLALLGGLLALLTLARAEPPDTANRGWRYGDDLSRFGTPPAALQQTCGGCHAAPAPDVIVRPEWGRILLNMQKKMAGVKGLPEPAQIREVMDWYVAKAPGDLQLLPNAPRGGPLEFRSEGIGKLKRNVAMVTGVTLADVDGDGRPEVIVCDGASGGVSLVRVRGDLRTEEVVGSGEFPVRTAVFDADGDGDRDIAVARLGTMKEVDEPVGSVRLLVNNGEKGWEGRDLAKGLPRATDVQPGDFDGDGDLDLSVAAFGGVNRGAIGWLRNDGLAWEFVPLADVAGAIHAPVADLDGDGKPDIAAIVSQETESIVVFANKAGSFEAKTVFESRNPLFGSSSLRLLDFDGDADVDMLFTNGDALSDPCMMPWPYHGVAWLENRGNLQFEYRDIARCYGPFGAVAADFDSDGDLDVAVTVLCGKGRPDDVGLLWFENDGKMAFRRHDVLSPLHLCALEAGDVDGDGALDLVTGQLSMFGAPGENGSELLKWTVTKRK